MLIHRVGLLLLLLLLLLFAFTNYTTRERSFTAKLA
jgi:uncharacterized integral membrane protein